MPKDIRPTRDFVREAIFNIIGLNIRDKIVYDICAGSGAYGLEALSRGAKKVIFVEIDKLNADIIKANLAPFAQDKYNVLVMSFLKMPPIERGALVFFDPPYAQKDLYEDIFKLALPAEILITESNEPLSHEKYNLISTRKYGKNYISFLEPQSIKSVY